MSGSAYLDDPEEIAKFTATTSSTQFPAAISAIAPLYRLEDGGMAAPSDSSSQILLTIQGEGIQIYSVLDSKCLRSWTFPPSVRFACPAKYLAQNSIKSKTSDSYVYVVLDASDGIISQNQEGVVWRWTDRGIDSIGLEDKIEASFTSPIFALEPGATRAGHLLVVHSNGSMTLSGHDLSKVFSMSSPVSGQAQLLWYQLVDVSQSMRSYLDSRQVTDWLDGDFRLVLVLCRVKDLDEQDGNMFSYYLSLLAIDGIDAAIVEVGTTRINPTYLRAQPLACAFDADTGILAVLTQAGVYQNLNLQMGSSALDDAIVLGQTKEVVLRGFIPCVGNSKKGAAALSTNIITQSQLTLTSLTERYVAITGTHSVVSHASKGPYESVLTLWDLQYGCLHAEKALRVAPAHLQAGSKQQPLPRLIYQVQPLSPRLSEQGVSNDQISLGIMVAQTSMPHSFFDGGANSANTSIAKSNKKRSNAGSTTTWNIETFFASVFLPPVTLLASLRLQNNAKYFVDPEVQSSRRTSVHSSNILLHEEQEQGLGVLRSGWEAIVDGTAGDVSGKNKTDTVEMFLNISQRRENTQREENEVLLALANVSDSVDSDQYTALFMDHIGISSGSGSPIAQDSPTWISSYLMTTVMRRCFAEPLGVSRSSQLPLFAPRVIEFMLVNCGLCNSHAPAPGLLPHLLARVDKKKNAVLADDLAWNLIDIALRRCPDLPERHVVDVLQFQLSHYSDYVDMLFDITAPLADCDSEDSAPNRVAAGVRRTVSAIANITGNDDMTRLALSSLSLSQAVCVIRLLVIWLGEWSQLGANVEMAASAAFVSGANAAMPSQIYKLATADDREDADMIASTISRTIAQANNGLTEQQSLEGVPTVDASLTVFKHPRTISGSEDSGAVIVRAFTNKWAPVLELPKQLAGAPELRVIVDFVSLLLDAHMTNILLSAEFSGLISKLRIAVDEALAISDQFRLLRIGLLPFHSAWKKQQDERAAKDIAKQREILGLDEVVLKNGTTRSQAERQRQIQPNAKCAQGTGSVGTYWEQVQKLEKYRVEVMHW
ncbi:hypothetical protein GGI25_004008 [Coemansia spiralis]|uniref:Uncharacterized protein n=2 Tax=Coemansia TaxID=4863 RepID=A0A9W8G5K5_9FUNG|nr:hypothetical protein EDC05_004279 [Coemansia umbellata]KAJ2623805.1 hypothetical protein GGI26_002043 [Coemansia sp. RSA 1358]KAJ2675270.1 hypothetical protein GGI25_004008 [Coemansia spiralis]